ncbi:hypothetical protein ACEXQD_13850 [Herbiconiux sp. P15]|uniref:hypothetical protein n=1 Tax=Herbiconiux liukaitaii TaxID=3342799 RepID=UPI0035B6BB36
MAVQQGGASWKATVAIAIAYFVIAVGTSPLFFGGADVPAWRWLLTVGWVALGVVQLVRARKKYTAEKRAAAELADPTKPAEPATPADQ